MNVRRIFTLTFFLNFIYLFPDLFLFGPSPSLVSTSGVCSIFFGQRHFNDLLLENCGLY